MPLEQFLRHLAGHDLPGWQVASRHRLRVMHPDFAARRGRNGHVADANLIQANALAGALEDHIGHPLANPQRLASQRRHRLSGDLEDQRHPAHDAVAIRDEGERAVALGGIGQRRKAADDVIEGMQPARRRLSSDDEARHFGRQLGRVLRRFRRFGAVDRKTDDDVTARHALGEHPVMVGQCDERLAQAALQLPKVDRRLRRRAVRLGKDDVEADRRHPGNAQLVDQLGQPGARPRPLAEAGQALVVDIHDTYRRLGIGARFPALILVEQVVAQRLQEQGIGQQQKETGHHGQQRQQPGQTRILLAGHDLSHFRNSTRR